MPVACFLQMPQLLRATGLSLNTEDGLPWLLPYSARPCFSAGTIAWLLTWLVCNPVVWALPPLVLC
jgi:hypothetical protein